MTPVVIVLFALLGVLFIGIVIGGYVFHWQWTGFASYPKERGDPERRPVTFFVWLSVLIVPATVAIVGVGFAYWQHQVALDVQNKQAKSALEVQRAQAKNEAVESYLDDLGTLLVEQDLLTISKLSLSVIIAGDPYRKKPERCPKIQTKRSRFPPSGECQTSCGRSSNRS